MIKAPLICLTTLTANAFVAVPHTKFGLVPKHGKMKTCSSTTTSLLSSGWFEVWEDSSFSGKSKNFALSDYTSGKVHSFAGFSIQDKASSIKWDFGDNPIAVTLCQNVKYPDLPDLGGMGKTIDLTGAGQINNLQDYGTNDCLSSFFYRVIDPALGKIVLYQDDSFQGPRQTLFLSDWPSEGTINIHKWYIQDKTSSVAWPNLSDNVYVSLYQDIDAKGSCYQNIFARDNEDDNKISTLRAYNLNDKVSCIKMELMRPKREEIEVFSIVIDKPDDAEAVSIEAHGTVEGDEAEGEYEASFTQTLSETTSITTTESHTVGGSLTFTYATSVEVPSVASVSKELSIEMHYDYTKETSTTAEHTEDIEVSVSETYSIPDNSVWSYKWMASRGTADVSFATTALRWYENQLKGSTYDSNYGWWKRTETITGTLQGSLYFDTTSNFEVSDT